jgi:CBS domain-containing protein
VPSIVSNDGASRSTAIVSERDVVRHLHEHGDAILDGPISEIAVWHVSTCGLDDSAQRAVHDDDASAVSGTSRSSEQGRLVGIISIGDVVKSTISELEFDRQNLIDYVQG